MVTSNRRRGFTLIELMTVVVIIGILASLAIVRYTSTKERAIEATMRSDLRTLASRQESYFFEHNRFASSVDVLNFAPPQGVVLTIVQGDAAGWSATMKHDGISSVTCAVYFANAAPVPPADQEGAIVCK